MRALLPSRAGLSKRERMPAAALACGAGLGRGRSSFAVSLKGPGAANRMAQSPRDPLDGETNSEAAIRDSGQDRCRGSRQAPAGSGEQADCGGTVLERPCTNLTLFPLLAPPSRLAARSPIDSAGEPHIDRGRHLSARPMHDEPRDGRPRIRLTKLAHGAG